MTTHPQNASRTSDWFTDRSHTPALAIETTILTHGLPKPDAASLMADIRSIASQAGVQAAIIGIRQGRAIVGMTEDEVHGLIHNASVPKTNSANLGAILHAGLDGATTVSTTLELAALASIRVFSTGGIGGVHKHLADRLDISADLGALARYPVATVASGCKNILDLTATRELLETLGVPVIGFRCDTFPAFYQRETSLPVDARFDDPDALADFVRFELDRTGRGLLVVNPIPEANEIPLPIWNEWLAEAERASANASGRQATPAILEAVHRISDGRTIRANTALARSNAVLGASIAAGLHHRGQPGSVWNG